MLQQKTLITNTGIDREVKSDPLARFRNSLKASRALQNIKLAEGVKGIERYVEDVEGDWLENWDDEE